MVKWNEDINQYVQRAAPLITFFSLPATQQTAMLPRLETKHNYDFPEGDLVTNKALEVLLHGYQACLNAIAIRLLVILDESDNEDVKGLADQVDQLLETIHTILESPPEEMSWVENLSSVFLHSVTWSRLRQLSLSVQQRVEIWVDLSPTTLTTCMNMWLHP